MSEESAFDKTAAADGEAPGKGYDVMIQRHFKKRWFRPGMKQTGVTISSRGRAVPHQQQQKTAAFDAGVVDGLEKAAAMAVIKVRESPSSVETAAIRDPAERRRYLADMAARNVRGAMSRPSSVRAAVSAQEKGGA